MSIKTLELAIIGEARKISGRSTLRVKDMMEWSTSEDLVRKNVKDGEEVIHCPEHGVWIAVPIEKKKKKK